MYDSYKAILSNGRGLLMSTSDETPKTNLKIDSQFALSTKQASDGYLLLRQESERGSVLVGGAMLDEMLGAILKAFFVGDKKLIKELLYGPNAPAATFSSRIRLCRAIGLITDEVYRDLDRIRSIRNKAAHFNRRGEKGFDFTFKDPEISDECRALKTFSDVDRSELPPRILFEAFVTIVAGVLKEHAIAMRLVGDNLGESSARELMYELLPTVDIRGHLQKLCDSVRELLRSAELTKTEIERKD